MVAAAGGGGGGLCGQKEANVCRACNPDTLVVVLLSFECCAIICGISVSGCDRKLEADTK